MEPRRRQNKQEEKTIQKLTVKRIKDHYGTDEDGDCNILLTCSIAGVYLQKTTIFELQSLGYLVGTCDLFILEARKGYHGLLLELKAPDGVASKAQEKFALRANKNGYLAIIIEPLETKEETIALTVQTIKDYLAK